MKEESIIKFRGDKKADFGVMMCLASDPYMLVDDFEIGINVDIERDVPELLIIGKRNNTPIIEYSEILDPKRNNELNREEMYYKIKQYDDWEKNPKVKILMDYTNGQALEIKKAMPYDVKVKVSYVKPEIMNGYMTIIRQDLME